MSVSGSGTSNRKSRLSHKLFGRFTSPSPKPNTTRIRSRSPSPAAPHSSNAHSQVVLLPATQASISNPTPSISNISTSPAQYHSILQNAWQRLPAKQQNVLQPYMPLQSTNAFDAMEHSLIALKQKRQQCDAKRWKFTFAGREFILKETADKLIHWLDRFKSVGDVVANVDPIHVGLPWAGIRFILEAAVSEAQQMASLLIGCEVALYITNRLKVYADFLLKVPTSLSQTNFEASLVDLYLLILSFVAHAIENYRQSSLQRAFASFWLDSDVRDFEQNCHKVEVRVDIEASNCDRALSGQDRVLMQQLHTKLQQALAAIQHTHQLQTSFRRLEVKIDRDKLKYVAGATFDAYGQVHQACHPATRIEIIKSIQDWASQLSCQCMLWLQGMAGTGKSTISCTIADWLSKQSSSDVVNLGASFFFKRGEGNRGSAALLFPTIAYQLAMKIPGLDEFVADAIASNPDICDKALSQQFKTLIHIPIQQLQPGTNDTIYVIVIDALDECKTDDVDTVLQLWSQLSNITNLRLRLFLTSRPDPSIHSSFGRLSSDIYQPMMLDEVPRSLVQRDILTFLTDAFKRIRADNELLLLGGEPLAEQWPGEDILRELTEMAFPLFIVAATVYRFIVDPSEDPRERLEAILSSRRKIGQMSHMAPVYLPVLQQLHNPLRDRQDEGRLYAESRLVVGSIITLHEPLSQAALAELLGLSLRCVSLRLRPFSSVLQIPPPNSNGAVRLFHLSFSEFLTSQDAADAQFIVSIPAVHAILAEKCIELLSRSNPQTLHENMCGLNFPGQPRQELAPNTIQARLSTAVQYACRYWTRHIQGSLLTITKDDSVHRFLKKHFLHWLEALSLMGWISDAVILLSDLKSCVSTIAPDVLAFLEDARRFVLANRYIIDVAPLQLYSSALVFAPQNSLVRAVNSQTPTWLQRHPRSAMYWGPVLQNFEGHSASVNAVDFSSDGLLLASGSDDGSVRLWDISTGREILKLTIASEVLSIAFSPTKPLLAVGSLDDFIRTWDIHTGQEVQTLHACGPNMKVAFSQDGMFLAASSGDSMPGSFKETKIRHPENPRIHVWDAQTGQKLMKLSGHSRYYSPMAFSVNNTLAFWGEESTVIIWDLRTDRKVQKLLLSSRSTITTLAFSADGFLLASGSLPEKVRLWNTRSGRQILELDRSAAVMDFMAFSHDGSLLATAAIHDNSIRLWSTKTGEEVIRLQEHFSRILEVAFSPDGTLLASASADKTIRLWDVGMIVQTKGRSDEPETLSCITFSPDGSLLASSSSSLASERNNIRVWTSLTGCLLHELDCSSTGSLCSALTFLPTGTLLAAMFFARVILWDVKTGQAVHEFDVPYGWSRNLIFSPDGSSLVTRLWDGTVVLQEVHTGQSVRSLEGLSDSTEGLVFSPSGKILALGTGEGTLELWNTQTDDVQTIEGYSDTSVGVVFSADEFFISAISANGMVHTWNTQSGQLMRKFELRSAIQPILSCADGSILASTYLHRLLQAAQTPADVSTSNDTSPEDNASTILTTSGQSLATSSENDIVDFGSSEGQMIVFTGEWIRRGPHNLLWLPQEHRGKATYHGDIIAIGTNAGHVDIYQFRF